MSEDQKDNASELEDIIRRIHEAMAAFDVGGDTRPQAFPSLEQRTAWDGVTYRRYLGQGELGADEILLTATNENTGEGRALRVDGRLWRQIGERVTDDDIETILQHEHARNTVTFFKPHEREDGGGAEEMTELERDLFMTDPRVLERVHQNMELMAHGVDDETRLEEGLHRAYVRATDRRMPEAEWLDDATRRARSIMNRREAYL